MKSWTKSQIRKYLGLLLVVGGLAYTYHSHITGCPRHVIFAGWALGPPVWFILEYSLFFDAENEIIIADIGHFESEQYTSNRIATILKKKFTTFAVHLTEVNTNPINYF